ncbi:hypothetical protein [Pseudomonas phage Almagne]|nr:hypothetical protein [Pseudomonas phage Almagne]
MDESNLFKRLKKATPGFDWTRHEDKLTSGIPDASYGAEGVGGWVELKTYDAWPRNASQPLKFTDLKPTQVNWAIRRGRKQRRVWFLVAIGDECWLLIRWKYARQLGKLTQRELLLAADAHGTFPIPKGISRVFTQPETKEYDDQASNGGSENDPHQRSSRAGLAGQTPVRRVPRNLSRLRAGT